MRRLFPIIIATLLLSACHKNTFVIEGTLDNGANKTIYIEEITPNEGPLFIDSVKLDGKGHFTFRYKPPYESFYNIHVTNEDYVVLLPQGGEKVKLTGDYTMLESTYQVEGSPESTLLWQLQDYSNMGVERLKEIVAIDRQNRERCTASKSKNGASPKLDTIKYKKLKEVTDSMFRDAFLEQQSYVTEFITRNRGSLSTLIALYKPFNNHPLINSEDNFDYYEYVADGLEEMLPENPHTVHFRNTVEYLRHRVPKKEAADFDINIAAK